MNTSSVRRFRGVLWIVTMVFVCPGWAAPEAPPAGAVLSVVEPRDVRDPRPAGQLIVRANWGSGPGEFGKVDEASRPGPTDFCVVDGLLYALDPVNARVLVFDLESGAFEREVAIGTRTADFLHVDRGGRISVLDPFVQRELRMFDSSGTMRRRVKLPAEIRLASAVFTDEDRVWIEERHDKVIEIAASAASEGGAARVVETLPGRPLPDRRRLHARKAGESEVAIRITSAEGGEAVTTVRFGGALASVSALEADAQGNVYVAVRRPRRPEGERETADIVVARVAADRSGCDSLVMPDAYVTDHYRKLLVTPGGEVIQMQTFEDGVRFVRWRFGQTDGERSAS